ncbi:MULTISPECIES: response regulator [Paraburkholderia]|uniref:response regulator n=1 Tax=Paraburkholderia TaxID=1822464 RepID=UPI00225619E3|nr:MULTISPECIES: response regulator [Paraburkholderia]MCX4154551.1 response regulator [Paraburkholderia aspalathi]MDN7163966.1 response regulator [Paraburkholderia sp. SECH2]MDQ6392451.1 response regulator [Paraburkholderia aspalathi]
MNNFIRPPVSYPASVVFVDDSDSYLDALRRFFPDVSINLFFTRPQTALAFIRKHAREHSLVFAPASAGLSEVGLERFVETSAERDVLARNARFSEVAAVVVDYDMPGLSGVEFLSSISNLRCAKVLLTGVADETVAVKAFNAGIVDLYLRKTDADSANRLVHFLKDARNRHCSEAGWLGLGENGLTYCDPRTSKAIDAVVAAENIVEYYWRPEQNAILMFDRAGNPSVFLAWAENDWIAQAEIVADESGPADLLRRMAVRESMPIFWPYLAYRPGTNYKTVTPQSIPGWDDAFYCWSRIDSADVGLSTQTFSQWRSGRMQQTHS